MSHLKVRRDRNCLNCGTEVQGRYCHVCGQENIEPKESFWHLISHFFRDITHFDGKFFSTLKYLVIKPGFLSKEYMKGRRVSYLNPIRMYVFTSAFFFLLFFTFFNSGKKEFKNSITINSKTLAEVDKMDSIAFDLYTREINQENFHKDTPMSRLGFSHYADSVLNSGSFQVLRVPYASKEAYDSVLKTGIRKDSWLERKIVYKALELNSKYKNSGDLAMYSFKEALLHSVPQMLFLSLPLLALLLKLLYVRQKNFYYVSHAIFSIHFYVFVFIALLVLFSLNEIIPQLSRQISNIINIVFYLGLFFYEYKAMRHFYQQRRAKTVLKFLLLNFLFLIVMLVLFVVFVFLSLFKL